MTQQPRTPPSRSVVGQAARAKRDARLAEALRANLRKRKTQARDRAAAAVSDGGPGGESGREPSGEPGGEA